MPSLFLIALLDAAIVVFTILVAPTPTLRLAVGGAWVAWLLLSVLAILCSKD